MKQATMRIGFAQRSTYRRLIVWRIGGLIEIFWDARTWLLAWLVSPIAAVEIYRDQ
ncbi:hypothetical protein [Thiorhodovibrio litoralis]|uniref:hypothetical protein n=1 Tax=Thiorhodovibrio litoralis TaxID=2952932 RepID=UPI002B2646A8|nr:hypothetical protein [Thiorhodovibrio litoralis]